MRAGRYVSAHAPWKGKSICLTHKQTSAQKRLLLAQPEQVRQARFTMNASCYPEKQNRRGRGDASGSLQDDSIWLYAACCSFAAHT